MTQPDIPSQPGATSGAGTEPGQGSGAPPTGAPPTGAPPTGAPATDAWGGTPPGSTAPAWSGAPFPGSVPPPPAGVPPFPGGMPQGPAAYVPPPSMPGAGQAPPPPPPPGYAVPGRYEPRRSDTSGVAGLILIAAGALALLGHYVPDAGQYIVLAIGLVLLVLFVVNREYGALIPGCILTGIGVGIPLAAANPGELGGALVLISLGCGFIAIWLLSFLFRLPDHHWWPLVPGLILGTIGAGMAAGERNQAVADAINVGWPVVLVAAGVLLLFGAVRRRA